jgi:hypothetical protein
VSFATIILYVASQQVFIAVFYFVIDSVRKVLDTSIQPINQPTPWSRIPIEKLIVAKLVKKFRDFYGTR